MKKLQLRKIIENGGATLDKSGKAVDFARGYQVSRRDCYWRRSMGFYRKSVQASLSGFGSIRA